MASSQGKKHEYSVVNQSNVLVEPPYDDDTSTVKSDRAKAWRQFLIGGVVNIGSVILGMCMGWMSPAQHILMDPTETPLDRVATLGEISWISSMHAVGSIFGPIVGAYSTNKIGRRGAYLLCAPILTLGWLMVTFASRVWMLFAGRLLWGFSAGIFITATPLYCAEISTDEYRGVIGIFVHTFHVFGTQVSYVIAPYTSYLTLGITGTIVSIIFTIGVFLVPESPTYLLMEGKEESAKQSLYKCRGTSKKALQHEFDNLQVQVKSMMNKKTNFTEIFVDRATIKGVLISWGLVASNALSGLALVMFFMRYLFDESAGSIDPHVATQVVGWANVISSVLASFVVHKYNRRLLLFGSCSLMAMNHLLIGAYFYLKSNHYEIANEMGYVPFINIISYLVFANFGLSSLAWGYSAEVVPVNVKHHVAAGSVIVFWACSFAHTSNLNNFAVIGLHYAFWLCSLSLFLSIAFVYYLVPETRGKSLDEIQAMLSRSTFNVNKSK